MISRRRFLLATLLAPTLARASGGIRFPAYPFTLGVASGAPTADGIALWTRLAPTPLEGGGMPPEPVEVRWEIAHDEAFSRIARKGTALAVPENAHAVHVEAGGLEPGRAYFYRFVAGGEASPVARTRTAPAPGRGDERLRIALASCQQYEHGFYVAHRHLAAEGVDLVAFAGDYIYESSWGSNFVRQHHKPEPATLADYRDRYALYKTDADLQKAHAVAPWIVTWDDHEVDNDYAGEQAQDLDPAFAARRAAAYKAYFEHMPLRRSALLAGGGVRLYGSTGWGGLATFHVLDDRQYRTPQACPRPGRGGSNTVGDACTERLDPRRTLLGAAQEAWLDESLGRSRARWNFILQQTLFSPSGRETPKEGRVRWTDGWDGYPAARARLIRSLRERRPANPVILGGDVHAELFGTVHAEPEDPASPAVAAEVVTTSITSRGMNAFTLKTILEANAHLRYGESTRRGYTVLDVTRARTEVRHRGVTTVKEAGAGIETLGSAAIEAGRPGLA